jgi:hypothetical protein
MGGFFVFKGGGKILAIASSLPLFQRHPQVLCLGPILERIL